jgi:hypothetical protein
MRWLDAALTQRVTIITNAGPWDENFIDKPEETTHTQFLGRINGDISDVIAHTTNFNSVVDKARIPYNPTGPNSNTYASEFLRSIGIDDPITDRLTPGFRDRLGIDLPYLPSAVAGLPG